MDLRPEPKADLRSELDPNKEIELEISDRPL